MQFQEARTAALQNLNTMNSLTGIAAVRTMSSNHPRRASLRPVRPIADITAATDEASRPVQAVAEGLDLEMKVKKLVSAEPGQEEVVQSAAPTEVPEPEIKAEKEFAAETDEDQAMQAAEEMARSTYPGYLTEVHKLNQGQYGQLCNLTGMSAWAVAAYTYGPILTAAVKQFLPLPAKVIMAGLQLPVAAAFLSTAQGDCALYAARQQLRMIDPEMAALHRHFTSNLLMNTLEDLGAAWLKTYRRDNLI